MAEALADLLEPVTTALDTGPSLPAEEVARRIARSLAPPGSDAVPPPWLRAEQQGSFRRVVAAIERHGGALLADPVGSGKTYIALAVAARLPPGRTVAIVPASLRRQWQARAASLGVPVVVHSHEALSRGRLPSADPALVIVDESHRFRHPEIRRYRVLARWLVGRGVLLLSATPVVNRLADLAHQLRLGVRDDALARRGVPSLRTALAGRETPPAIGDLVLCRPAPAARPARRSVTLAAPPTAFEEELLVAIGGLSLSPAPGVASLIRTTLWKALGSSPAALAGALGRYRALLEHGRAAAGAGCRVSRAAIRAFAGEQLEQLVLWDLLPPAPEADLVLADLPQVSHLLARLHRAPPETRLTILQDLLPDGTPTLVFSASRDTVDALRRRLAALHPAWLTGNAAGIGHTRIPREAALRCFAPEASGVFPRFAARGSPTRLPGVLLTTDVSAEGLDLQRAARVIHYDLPWTSVRLEQREGRAIRLGGTREVEVLRFAPWPALEARLGQELALRRTAALPAAAGVGDPGRWHYRWRVELAEAAGPGAVEGGFAVVAGDRPGWLAGVALDTLLPGGQVEQAPASLLWLPDAGPPSDHPPEVSALLAGAARTPSRMPAGAERRACLAALGPVIRNRLAEASASTWLARNAPPEQRRLARRMRALAADAARRRDRLRLATADAALTWLMGGVTAGEAALIQELAATPAARLLDAWHHLRLRPRQPAVLLPRLTGVLRVTTFPACQRSAPYCSTSTGPSSIPSN